MFLQTLQFYQKKVFRLAGLASTLESVQQRHRARTQDLKLFELKAKQNDEHEKYPINIFQLIIKQQNGVIKLTSIDLFCVIFLSVRAQHCREPGSSVCPPLQTIHLAVA